MQSQQKVSDMTLSKQLVKRSIYLYVLPATNHLFVGACNESGELNDLKYADTRFGEKKQDGVAVWVLGG